MDTVVQGFLPWIGSRWGEPNGTFGGARLLVLGEAHYDSDNNADERLTIDVVTQYLSTHDRAFFTKLTALLATTDARNLTAEEIAAVWESVAFLNYIPTSVGTEARVVPNPDLFKQGAGRFLRFLDGQRVDCVLVLGYRLWRNLPPAGWVPEEHLPDTMKGQGAVLYPAGRNRYALAAPVWHPSSAFRWRDWRPVLNWLLENRNQAFTPVMIGSP